MIAAAKSRAAALVAGDADALRQLMHPSLRWTTYRGVTLDRDSYIEGNTESALVWLRQELDEIEVWVVGDVAVLTAIVTDSVRENGVEIVNRLGLTQTWVRAGTAWQCIAGHAGPPVAE